jgi:hypothetical protein
MLIDWKKGLSTLKARPTDGGGGGGDDSDAKKKKLFKLKTGFATVWVDKAWVRDG